MTTRKTYADGFAIVRDDGPHGPVYLTSVSISGGYWVEDGARALVFKSAKLARLWIRSRAPGFWLAFDAGRPRIISARAAGAARS